MVKFALSASFKHFVFVTVGQTIPDAHNSNKIIIQYLDLVLCREANNGFGEGGWGRKMKLTKVDNYCVREQSQRTSKVNFIAFREFDGKTISTIKQNSYKFISSLFQLGIWRFRFKKWNYNRNKKKSHVDLFFIMICFSSLQE